MPSRFVLRFSGAARALHRRGHPLRGLRWLRRRWTQRPGRCRRRSRIRFHRTRPSPLPRRCASQAAHTSCAEPSSGLKGLARPPPSSTIMAARAIRRSITWESSRDGSKSEGSSSSSPSAGVRAVPRDRIGRHWLRRDRKRSAIGRRSSSSMRRATTSSRGSRSSRRSRMITRLRSEIKRLELDRGIKGDTLK